MSRRFDWRFELENIYDGMNRDVQQQVGQSIPWYLYDPVNTVVDPIYDVGATPSGRRWKLPPIWLPVLGAVKLEGQRVPNDDGLYIGDTLHIVFSPRAAQLAGLGDLLLRPDAHDVDRIVYENKVFTIEQIRVRGIVTAGYAVCAADAIQVKPEELVNDPQFQSFITTDDGLA